MRNVRLGGRRIQRSSQAGSPRRSSGRGDHRQHEVQHHVDAVGGLLGDVVDRPVGRDLERHEPEDEARDLEPAGGPLPGERVARAEAHDRDRVPGGEGGDEQPRAGLGPPRRDAR